MTTPRVIELPRRLEPISSDTFLRGCDDFGSGDAQPLAAVIALRPRDPLAARRSPGARRAVRAPRLVVVPGFDSAA